MKKIISLVLAVAMVATMFTAVMPVYAADASITLSTTEVAVQPDGSYGTLTATISGVSASSDPWAAFVLKSEWTGTYVSASHTGWWQFTAGQVPDGTVVDLSWENRVHTSKGALEYDKEYVLVLVDGNTAVATAEFKTTKGFVSVTEAHQGLYGEPASGVWVSQADAVTTTYFTAAGEFSSVAFNTWTNSTNAWKFELVKVSGSTETVVDTVTTPVLQDNLNVVEFATQQAGTYGFRVSATDTYVAGEYIILPVAPVVSNSYVSNVYTTIYNCATQSADALAAQTSTAAIAVYMTANSTVTPEPATDVSVELAIMDTTDNLYNAVSELKEGTVYQVDAYLTGYTSASDAIAGLEVNIPFDQYTSTFITTSEKTGYSFDGTTNFATLVTPEGSDVATSAKFASVYGTQGDSGFVFSRLEDTDSNPTDGRIQLFAYTFRLVEGATGEITFPVEIIASGSDSLDYGYTAETVTLPVAGSVDTGDTTSLFQTSFDSVLVDGSEIAAGNGIGSQDTKFVWSSFGHLAVPVGTTSIVINGWCLTPNAVASYQYSINGGEWIDIEGGVGPRADLTAHGAYGTETTAATGGMANLTIPLAGLTQATGNTVDLRFVDGAGKTGEIIQFTVDREVVFTSYHLHLDRIELDGVENAIGNGAGNGAKVDINEYIATLTASETVKIAGWNINGDGGTKTWQISVNGGAWTDIVGSYDYPGISDAAGLADYSASDSTGGISLTFNVADYLTAGTTNTVDLRVVTATNEYVYDAVTMDITVPEATVEPTTYDISVGTVTNGTVTVSANTVEEGTSVTVTATPATGYTLNQILVNGVAITGTSFVPTADSVVTATFTAINYTITAGTATNGTVTVDKSTATIGQTVTVTATPATGYKLNQILVNGTAISGNTFTVSGNSTVTATFTAINYTITVGAATNGTVTVDKTTATIGQTVTVTATPSAGYELDAILVNGSAITGNTFTVSGNTTVTATFKAVVVAPTTYTITVTVAGRGNGAVTVNGTSNNRTGASAASTFTYEVVAGTAVNLTSASAFFTKSGKDYSSICTIIESADVSLSCTNVTKTGEFTGATFTMPEGNVTITVRFQIFGDTNLNGTVNALDASAVKKHTSSSSGTLTAEQLMVTNLTGSYSTSKGTVNAMDYAQLKKFMSSGKTFTNGTYA